MPLKKFKETECSCEVCSAMCRRLCWGTPKEMQALIDAGYGDRLMRDYWVGNPKDNSDYIDTQILCPALKGSEGEESPFIPKSEEGCTFWHNGLCELHDKGLKPLEARVCDCKESSDEQVPEGIHEYCATTWANKKAQKLVKKWQEEHEST